MKDYFYKTDLKTGRHWLETPHKGKKLLNFPLLSKGTAFTQEERLRLGLLGKLPIQVETIEQQVSRVYSQLNRFENNLQKNIYLMSLLERNQTLFYRLIKDNLHEVLPIIYTPIVGTAVKEFSREFRVPRGLYVSYPDLDRIDEILANRTPSDVDIIVASDGQGVLGIGDQGIGGMDIPVAKLSVYTICGGIFPGLTLPVMLDVGTDNQELLDDPLYLGWRHERVTGKKYDEFIDAFVEAVKRNCPKAFLHWEDFGRDNAKRILDKHRENVCSFNDDIQGTGVVAASAVMTGAKVNKQLLHDQRIIIFGGGTAGIGIADQLSDIMINSGVSESLARKCFWIIDRNGLVIEGQKDIPDIQKLYVRSLSDISNWKLNSTDNVSLLDVVTNLKPTVLIGCSAVPGAFSEVVVSKMCENLNDSIRPIIMPLSNPTERAEAVPEDLLNWSNGRALIATGSPFKPVEYGNSICEIAQCNNLLSFPGIGLAVSSVYPTKVSQGMLVEACLALSKQSYPNITNMILPKIENPLEISKKVALAVANKAIEEGLAENIEGYSVEDRIEHKIWLPEYLPIENI